MQGGVGGAGRGGGENQCQIVFYMLTHTFCLARMPGEGVPLVRAPALHKGKLPLLRAHSAQSEMRVCVCASPPRLQGPLSCWAESQSCFTMMLYLLWGFDLELYLPHEAASVFWWVAARCLHSLHACWPTHPHTLIHT